MHKIADADKVQRLRAQLRDRTPVTALGVNFVACEAQRGRQLHRRRGEGGERRINRNVGGDMRLGSDQRRRGPYDGNRPFQQHQRTPQYSQTFDSNGPSVKLRGNAGQIFERYVALAREAAIAGDPIAAENLYQHAEHYFRISNLSREGNQQGALRPTVPADTAVTGTEPGSNEADLERSQPGQEDDRPGFV